MAEYRLTLKLQVEVEEQDGHWTAMMPGLGLFVQAKTEADLQVRLTKAVELALGMSNDPKTRRMELPLGGTQLALIP